MNIETIIAERDIEIIPGYTYLLHDGQYYRGCKRCGGSGHYSFNGFDSICYECGNAAYAKLGVCVGTLEDATKDANRRNKARLARIAAAEKKRLVLVAKTDAKIAALRATHPAVVEFLEGINTGDEYGEGRDKDSFVIAMHEALFYVSNCDRPFSEKMIAATEKAMERRAAKTAEAEAHPAPTGRVRVTGEIVSAKTVESDYGTAYKILVRDDAGFKVWCSIPKAQADEAFDEYREAYILRGQSDHDFGPACWFLGAQGTDEQGVKGRRIAFDAKLEPSRDDKSFAFGSRPTKGEWLA